MDTRTTRNMTTNPVQIAAVESLLSGLEETDSEIHLPGAHTTEGRGKEARDWLLDVVQQLQVVIGQNSVRAFLDTDPRELLPGFDVGNPLGTTSPAHRLQVAAQLPLSSYYSQAVSVDPFLYATASEHAHGFAEALDGLLEVGLWQLVADLWRAAQALLRDGVLSFEGGMLVWHYAEDRTSL